MKQNSLSLVRHLWIWPEAALLLLTSVASGIVQPLLMLHGIVQTVNGISAHSDSGILVGATMVCGSILSGSLSVVANGQFSIMIQQKVTRRITFQVLDRAFEIPISTFLHAATKDTAFRAANNTPASVGNLIGQIGSATTSLVSVISYLAYVASAGPVVLIAIVMSALPIALAARYRTSVERGALVEATPFLRAAGYFKAIALDFDAQAELRSLRSKEPLMTLWERSFGAASRIATASQWRVSSASMGAGVLAVIFLGLALFVTGGGRGVLTGGAAAALLQAALGSQRTLNGLLAGAGGMAVNLRNISDLEIFSLPGRQAPLAENVPKPPLMARASNLGFQYSEGAFVFRSVSFEVMRGAWLAVTGPNGSGKTTLLRCVAGSLTPCEGNLALSVPREEVMYVPQRPAQVSGNIVEFMSLSPRSDVEIWRRLLDEFDIGIHSLEHTVGVLGDAADLSSGQWRKLAIARALAAKPTLLLLDEPTNDLDPTGVERLLRVLRRSSTTVIIATHDPRVIGSCHDGIAMPREMLACM